MQETTGKEMADAASAGWRLQHPARAMFFFWLIAAVVFSLTAALMQWNAHSRQIDNAKRNLETLSLVLSEQTTRTFQSVDLILQNTVERLGQTDALHWLESHRAQAVVNAVLRLRIFGATQIRSLFIVGPDGRVRYSALGSPVGVFVGDRDYVIAHKETVRTSSFISSPALNRVDGGASIFVSRRIEDSQGEYAGVVVASVPISYFDALYGSIRRDSDVSVILITHDGIALYADTPQHGAPALDALLSTMAGDPPHGLLHTGGAHAQIMALRATQGYPLLTAVSVSERHALGAWQEQALLTSIWVLGALLLLGLASIVLARRLVYERRLELSLRESEARLQGIIGSAMDAIVTVDDRQRVVLFNAAAEKLFGCSADKAIGTRLERFIPPRYRPGHGSHMLAFGESGQTARIKRGRGDIVALREDGEEIIVDASIAQLEVGGKKLYTAILRDISGRLAREAELLRLNQQLREFSASLQTVREEERIRIARELHDDLGQQLTGLKLGLSSIGTRLRQDRPDLHERIVALLGQIDIAVHSIRRLGAELRPLVLDDLGLFPAADWLADDMAKKSGLQIDIELDEDAEPHLGEEISSALFRILQESLNNVVRHAHATRVKIELKADSERLILRVTDDGKGMDPALRSKPQGSFGLIGIRERAWMLGGEVHITSQAGSGTTIEVTVPMPHPPSPKEEV